jgi:hypothetical protein
MSFKNLTVKEEEFVMEIEYHQVGLLSSSLS